jgi:di/tricarboxylate transporter
VHVATWIVLAVLVVLLIALVRGVATPPALLVGALVVLVVTGVVTPERAFVGFSSPATITIAGLFVVARALRDHLDLEGVVTRVLDADGRSLRPVLLRLLPPVALLSGVVNNTPIVAATAPVVRDWAHRHGIVPSRLLIPLSFATILGGTLTTIGTSTNLVVSGALEAAGREPLGFFTVTALGAPVAVIGLTLLVLLAPLALRRRGGTEGAVRAGVEPALLPPPETTTETATGPATESDPRRPSAANAVTTVELAPAAPSSRPYRVLVVGTTIGMVTVAAAGLLPMVTAVLLACAILVGCGAIGFRRAVEALHLDVLLIVASAIGLGVAVESSGLAAVLGRGVSAAASGRSPALGLLLVVLGTLVITELITNVAAAALVVPIAIDVAERVGGDPRGFAVAVAITASACFLTPIGYQTNTIVYGLGGARFGDFWRLGLPLALAVVTVCVLLVPSVWAAP